MLLSEVGRFLFEVWGSDNVLAPVEIIGKESL